MSSYNNLNDLLNGIKKQVQDVAQKEVKTKIKEVMKKNIEERVYSTYTPTEYNRRYDETDGLMADSSIDVNIDANSNGVDIIATDIATGNENYATADAIDEYITPIIETGEGYTWKNRPQTRKFLESTAEELANGTLEKTLKDGLNSRGIKTT